MPKTSDGIFYELHDGPRDAETVILSAGLGGSYGFFAPQMEALRKRFHVLGYDHRGTSRSVRKLTGPHSVEAMAEDIRIVMDAAGVDRAHIVGHAAGGNAGLAFAQRYPKRLGKLVAINSWSRPDPHIARCFEARLALLNNTGKAAYVKAQPIFLYPAGWISENDAKLNEEAAHQIAGFPPKEVMRQRINALLAFDIDASLPKIKAPVLVAASADDMLVPVACSERLAARLANATLDIAPWGGHGFSVTAAEKFNRTLMAFLRS